VQLVEEVDAELVADQEAAGRLRGERRAALRRVVTVDVERRPAVDLVHDVLGRPRHLHPLRRGPQAVVDAHAPGLPREDVQRQGRVARGGVRVSDVRGLERPVVARRTPDHLLEAPGRAQQLADQVLSGAVQAVDQQHRARREKPVRGLPAAR
jgi:hypothetical protein